MNHEFTEYCGISRGSLSRFPVYTTVLHNDDSRPSSSELRKTCKQKTNK